MLIRGEPNPPTPTTIAVIVGFGLVLIALGLVSFGLTIIAVFALVSLIEFLWVRFYR